MRRLAERESPPKVGPSPPAGHDRTECPLPPPMPFALPSAAPGTGCYALLQRERARRQVAAPTLPDLLETKRPACYPGWDWLGIYRAASLQGTRLSATEDRVAHISIAIELRLETVGEIANTIRLGCWIPILITLTAAVAENVPVVAG
jgi:hypothetical protein